VIRRLAAVLLFAGICGVAVAAAPRPSTVALAPGRIAGVAQDGPRAMWGYVIPNSSACANAARVHNFANATEAPLTHAGRGSCLIDTPYGAGNEWFALAGRTALWTIHEYGNNTYVNVLTGTIGGPDSSRGQLIYANGDGVGDYFTGAAGDGSTLVYSWVYLVTHTDCVDDPNCQLYVAGGGVRQIVNGRQRKLPKVPPATAVAASGSRIALAVAPLGSPWKDILGPGRQIEVRRVPSGSLVDAFVVPGHVRALAVMNRLVAVLVSGTAQRIVQRILVYAAPARPHVMMVSGVLVPRTTEPALSFAGRTIVFHAGRTIYALNVATARIRVLVHTARPPIGVTIEGKRVAWAENYPAGHGDWRGRIKTLMLP
jgi:hypothetical protein